MEKTLSSKRNITLRHEYTAPQLRRIVRSRLETNMTGTISPIERWPDANYAPQALEYVWNHQPDYHEVIASLHGFEASCVRIDLNRGHVIILLSEDYSTATDAREEYYCEVPIPTDAKGNVAYVRIGSDFLTVRLDRKNPSLATVLATAWGAKEESRS